MLINKHRFQVSADKKMLRKIGKQWVTVSALTLALLGGGAVMSHTLTHADATQPQTVQQKNAKASQPSAQNVQSQAGQVHKQLLNASVQQSAQKPMQKSAQQPAQSQQSQAPQAKNAMTSQESNWPGSIYAKKNDGTSTQNNVHSDAVYNVPSDVQGSKQTSTLASGTHTVHYQHDTGQKHISVPEQPATGNQASYYTPKNPGGDVKLGSSLGKGKAQNDWYVQDGANWIDVASPEGTFHTPIGATVEGYAVTNSKYQGYFDYNPMMPGHKEVPAQYSDVYSDATRQSDNTANVTYDQIYHSSKGNNFGRLVTSQGWINLNSTSTPSDDWVLQDVTDPINYTYNNKVVGTSSQSGKPNATGTLNPTNVPAGYQLNPGAPKQITFNKAVINLGVSPLHQTDTVNFVDASDSTASDNDVLASVKLTGLDSRTGLDGSSFKLVRKPQALNSDYEVVPSQVNQMIGYDGKTHNVSVKVDMQTILSEFNALKADADEATTDLNDFEAMAHPQKQAQQPQQPSQTAQVTKPATNASSTSDASDFKPFDVNIQAPVLVHSTADSVGSAKHVIARLTLEDNDYLKVVGVKKVGNLYRFMVRFNGKVGYITANKHFTKSRYVYSLKHAHHIRLLKPAFEYRSIHFTASKRSHAHRVGSILAVKKIVLIPGTSVSRIQLTNGHWITANSDYIALV